MYFLIESKLCTIQYCNITIPYCNCTILCENYCDVPYCRIRRDAPTITATPSSLTKRRRRIPTIVPSYRPVLRRHQLIVESSGPLVTVVVRPVALLPLVITMPPVEVVVHSVAMLPLLLCHVVVPPVAVVYRPSPLSCRPSKLIVESSGPLVAVVVPHAALTSAAARRPPLLVADC